MSSPLPTVRDDFESRDPDFIRQFLPLFWLIASFWFRAEVRGLEKIPPAGPVLLVGNHSGGNMTPDTAAFVLAFSAYFGAERPLIRRSLNALEEQLDPATFFRAGRKEIVNLRWIEKVDIAVAGGLAITLRGGRTVEMSRRQSTRLREILSL